MQGSQAPQLSKLSLVTLNINRNLVDKLILLKSLLNGFNPHPEVIFIQEAGLTGSDPPGVLSLLLPDFHIFTSSSPGPDQMHTAPPFRASLVTLVSKSLIPDANVATVKRAPNGAAMLVKIGKLSLVNIYLPSGLDWAHSSSSAALQAHATYDWLADSIMATQDHSWVVAGDFNETTLDRERLSLASEDRPRTRRGVFIKEFLNRVGGADINNGTHTFHCNTKHGASSSLLDRFIIPRLLVGNILSYEVQEVGRSLSDHSAVHLIISLPIGLKPHTRKWEWTQQKFIIPTKPLLRQRAHERVNSIFGNLDINKGIVQALRVCSTSAQLEEASLALAGALTTASKQAFRLTQGERNRRPFRSRQNVQLNTLKNHLVQLTRLSSDSHSRPLIPPLLRKTSKGARMCFPLFPPAPGPDDHALLHWVRSLLTHTRKKIKCVFSEMRKFDWDSFVRAPFVSVFARKIVKRPRPPPVTSVPHPHTGMPTSDPDIVKQQLLLRVTEPMRRQETGPHRLPTNPTPSDSPEPGFPDWYHEIYTPIDVGNAWQGLCEPPSWEELKELVGNAKKHTSPGEGALGVDLLQCCIDWNIPFRSTGSLTPPGPIALALLEYLAAALRVGVYPAWTCTAWITTIDKGSKDPLDVRPISVLPELYRLISRVLNARILCVLRKHNLLHPAQRAGLSDGDFTQCLDVITNIIEDAKLSGALALTLYDQSKAFDLVTPVSITRACTRLGLPDKFISLVVSAMHRARARVRTAFGLSQVIDLYRSLRQGDPLSSILYCIYIDPLHTLLERLGGYRFSGSSELRVASAAFMDDTAVAANSFEELAPLHQAVVGFSLLNDGIINNTKSVLFLTPSVSGEHRALYTPAGPITPVDNPFEEAHRYLGLWINLGLTWKTMDNKIKANFWRIFYIIKNNSLPLKAAKLMIDIWLLPVYRQALRLSRYASEPDAINMLGELQKALNSLLAKNAGCPHPRNWAGPITSVLFNTKDLVQHALSLNIEALHLNLNLPAVGFPSAATTRTRLMNHLTRHKLLSAHPDENELLMKLESLNLRRSLHTRCDVASKLAVAMGQGLRFQANSLHCNARSFAPSIVSWDQLWEMVNCPLGGVHPTVDLIRTLLFNEPPATWDIYAYEIEWIRDLVMAPPLLIQNCCLSVYTDGSAKALDDAGAAAIFYCDTRRLLTLRTRLRGSKQSFFPECVGCLLAVKFAPLNVETEIICDCRSALFVAPKPASAFSWKKRLTSAARPALECIRVIILQRVAILRWRWVRAHTTFRDDDLDATHNSEVDTQAKTARGLLPPPPMNTRTWKWGAEQAILTTLAYPTLDISYPTPSTPRQVMGSIKGFLDRLQRVNLAKKAAKAETMGKALRYNPHQVLRVVNLLSKFASSTTHALIAMALAFYLPLANRRTWSTRLDPESGSCHWCAAGLRQDSPHIFNCPRLMWTASGAFLELHRTTQLSLSSTLRSALGSVVSHVDALRDCLALDLLHRTSELDSIPLPLDELRALPAPALALSAAFVKRVVPYSQSLSGRNNGTYKFCLAAEWKIWTTSFRLIIQSSDNVEPNSWNSAPAPALWSALQDPSLPAPFYAVVFDGTPALPPPGTLVWYTTAELRHNTAWWACQLPKATAVWRLFEWAPLITAESLKSRARWWIDAVSLSAHTIIWAVVPALADLSSLQTPHGLTCITSRHFSLQLTRPQDPHSFWVPRIAGMVQVKTVLIHNTLLPPTQRTAWSAVALTLPDLLLGFERSPKTTSDSYLTQIPANWWWGPTTRSHVHSQPHTVPPFLLGSRSPCTGSALCRATCLSPLHLTRFSRYLGNLGIPPTTITSLLSEAGPALLDGDRGPPTWIDSTWKTVGRLMRAAKTLK